MTTPKPTVIGPRKSQRLLPSGDLRELQSAYRVRKGQRKFSIGQRNPDTLPDGTKDRESESDNAYFTARWRKLGKLSRGTAWTGHKYL